MTVKKEYWRVFLSLFYGEFGTVTNISLRDPLRPSSGLSTNIFPPNFAGPREQARSEEKKEKSTMKRVFDLVYSENIGSVNRSLLIH